MLVFLRAIAFLFSAALIAMPQSALQAQAPVPIVDGYVVEGFVGWQKIQRGSADGNGIRYMHRPKSGPHMGSALWFFAMDGSNRRAAFIASAREGGISNVEILATHRMKKAVLLDNRGAGEVFIARGTREGKGPYTMAALVIYGSLDKAKDPALGVHMFVAPTTKYAQMGGWIVPASLFLNLNPQSEVHNVRAQGNATPALQARRFAETADIWSEWVLNEYIRMAQSNMQALSNFRKSVVCAGDPACVIVPGP
jgi:hypothetical protein